MSVLLPPAPPLNDALAATQTALNAIRQSLYTMQECIERSRASLAESREALVRVNEQHANAASWPFSQASTSSRSVPAATPRGNFRPRPSTGSGGVMPARPDDQSAGRRR